MIVINLRIFVQNKAQMKQDLYALFANNNGYLLASEIRGKRSLYYQLKEMIENGEAIQIKRGLYRYLEMVPGESWGQVCKSVTKGIICLFSAWQFYELTTSISSVVHLAIPAQKKYQLPDYPPVKLYYWSGKYYETGLISASYNGEDILIYDLEKSVCDIVRYRKKAGTEITTEVLKNYLKLKDRNIDKLMKYAEDLRIKGAMINYLEIML